MTIILEICLYRITNEQEYKLEKMLSSPESMSLGSPNQSPTYQMPPSQYLPQFLLGDSTVNPHLGINTRNNTPQMSSRYINSNNSPTRNINGASYHHHHHHSSSISPLSRSYSVNPYDQNRPNNQVDKSEFKYKKFKYLIKLKEVDKK